jgi:very-short-patch-repair endonuclease
MDKLLYVCRQLVRSKPKKYEYYVVSRIWHLLDDLSIKFITQQYVIRPAGHALTDMYFPQFGLHVEVDETYHLTQVEKDEMRESDIVHATEHMIRRIKTSEGLEHVNKAVADLVNEIHQLRKSKSDFQPWDIEVEQDPKTYIEKGKISIDDDVAFTHSYLAANCFGHNYRGYQRGGTIHPKEQNKSIWFPKLYKNAQWNNQIMDNDSKIVEICENHEESKKHIDATLKGNVEHRIVFARVKSPLGEVMYRFKGEFKLNREESNYENGVVWNRSAIEVKTYSA